MHHYESKYWVRITNAFLWPHSLRLTKPQIDVGMVPVNSFWDMLSHSDSIKLASVYWGKNGLQI